MLSAGGNIKITGIKNKSTTAFLVRSAVPQSTTNSPPSAVPRILYSAALLQHSGLDINRPHKACCWISVTGYLEGVYCWALSRVSRGQLLFV